MATYQGVCPNKGKFRVQITRRHLVTGARKYYHLGYWEDEDVAAVVYDIASKALHKADPGRPLVLNIPSARPTVELFDHVLQILSKKGLIDPNDERVWDYWANQPLDKPRTPPCVS